MKRRSVKRVDGSEYIAFCGVVGMGEIPLGNGSNGRFVIVSLYSSNYVLNAHDIVVISNGCSRITSTRLHAQSMPTALVSLTMQHSEQVP